LFSVLGLGDVSADTKRADDLSIQIANHHFRGGNPYTELVAKVDLFNLADQRLTGS